MSLRSNIRRGRIVIDPAKNSGATVYFSQGVFTFPPSVILTPSEYTIINLEETTTNHFSFRINSSSTQSITINYVAIERLTYEESTSMSRDFLATRSRTERIIGSGSTQKLIIYSEDNATDNVGGVNQTLQNKINALGNEVYLYIDGVPNGKQNATASSVVSFGGDVVISGKVYADALITTGALSSVWELDANNDLEISDNFDDPNGVFSISLSSGNLDYNASEFTIGDLLEELQSMNSLTISNKDQFLINDAFFEFDASGNVMPKLAS